MSVKKRLRVVADECNSFMGQRYNTICDAHISFLEKFIDKSPLFATFLEGIAKETLIEMLRHPWDIAFDPDQWLEKNRVTKDSDFKTFKINPKDRTYRWKANTYPELEVRWPTVTKDDVEDYKKFIESLDEDNPVFTIDSIPETAKKETRSFHDDVGPRDSFGKGEIIPALCLWMKELDKAVEFRDKIELAWVWPGNVRFPQSDRMQIWRALDTIPDEVLDKSYEEDWRKLVFAGGSCLIKYDALGEGVADYDKSVLFVSKHLAGMSRTLFVTAAESLLTGEVRYKSDDTLFKEFKAGVKFFLKRFPGKGVYEKLDPQVMRALRVINGEEKKEPFDKDVLKKKLTSTSLEGMYEDPEKNKYRSILLRERYKFSKMLSKSEAFLEEGEVREDVKGAYLIPAFEQPVESIPTPIIPVLLDILIYVRKNTFTVEEHDYLDNRHRELEESLEERNPGLCDAWLYNQN